MLSWISQFFVGWRVFLRGLSWLGSHPLCALALLLPIVAATGAAVVGWNLFVEYQDAIFARILYGRPEVWYGLALWYLLKGLMYLVILTLGILICLLVVNIVAAPVYDWVSMRVERDMTGEAKEITLWESLKLIGEELKKVAFILLVTLCVVLVPGLNIISPIITALLAGWDAYDYPLARRGFSFRRRITAVTKNATAVAGLGTWFLIPGVQIFCMPLAVVGGTILALEHLEKEEGRNG